MAILEMRAVRGWSLEQTATTFLITPLTISHWMHRLDEQGPGALVQTREPVNKFPDYVRYLIQRLRVLCPAMGKVKIAQLLARAGLHLGATTVGRLLREPPPPRPTVAANNTAGSSIVRAKHPNHVWHVDLTTVPTVSGFWAAWSPCALPQRWPFCWWLAVVIDHFSRRTQAVTTFTKEPTSKDVTTFLGRTVRTVGTAPKHLICDRGVQFDCHSFRCFCRRRKIRPRYGAIGKHGSIAVVERFILTLKQACLCLPLVPLRATSMRREIASYLVWYNEQRPHTFLAGRTPHEVYHGQFPANRRPRFEPRRWPRGSPCAKPWALTRGKPAARLELKVEFQNGHRHLPLVSLKRAA